MCALLKTFSQLSGEAMDRYLIGDNQNDELLFIDEIFKRER